MSDQVLPDVAFLLLPSSLFLNLVVELHVSSGAALEIRGQLCVQTALGPLFHSPRCHGHNSRMGTANESGGGEHTEERY